jgi:hypothetical protein
MACNLAPSSRARRQGAAPASIANDDMSNKTKRRGTRAAFELVDWQRLRLARVLNLFDCPAAEKHVTGQQEQSVAPNE